MLDGWRARLKGLLAEKPLTFAPCELFDLSFQGGFLLRPKVREEQESQPYGLTTGHHLGKPLPPDNQITAQSTGESTNMQLSSPQFSSCMNSYVPLVPLDMQDKKKIYFFVFP